MTTVLFLFSGWSKPSTEGQRLAVHGKLTDQVRSTYIYMRCNLFSLYFPFSLFLKIRLGGWEELSEYVFEGCWRYLEPMQVMMMMRHVVAFLVLLSLHLRVTVAFNTFRKRLNTELSVVVFLSPNTQFISKHSISFSVFRHFAHFV